MCSYIHQIINFSHITSNSISHLFCIILWLYNHLHFTDLEIFIAFLHLYCSIKRNKLDQKESSSNKSFKKSSSTIFFTNAILNSSPRVFFYTVYDTTFFITTTSKTAPINNKKHFKHNTELSLDLINFRNKLDNDINLNFNLFLIFSTKS